ncbi:LytR family transcriptional regulator [Streptomyces sp. Ru73]|uniref:LCP family protein n=1 Tax=Streptomyces sp. Ru73 TaxID=2080748 RepID=UPI000CDD6938|nr:LCP family protein [Streptomyces sp. Ru73]POX39708.1 LytR family transcriptional regulator [Streptomyces sp. Ru73]
MSPPPRTLPLPAPGRRRRRARWIVRVTAAASVVLLAASGVGHAMVTGVEKGITRVDAFKGMDHRPRPATGHGMTFLVAGTDGRDRLSKAEKDRYHLGGAPCHCTDTLMLVHLSAARDRASVISLPRDSYAEAPEYRDEKSGRTVPAHPIRLNAAYAEGGPNLTVRTVEHMTGVHIDHYLEVDFTSFMKTVDAVGGVQVCTSTPLKDRYTGLDLPRGRSELNGGEALQYVRARHLDGGSDLGRMQRQQRFLVALLHRITDSDALVNPVRFKKVTSTVLDSLRADAGFGPDEMMALGQALRGFKPSSSEFVSVPIGDMNYTDPKLGSTVKWDEDRAKKLFEAIRADRPLAVHKKRKQRATMVDVAPGEVRVQVENGTRVSGQAARTDKALRAEGFATTGAPRNAQSPAEHTEISYDPRWDRSVRTLAAALPGAKLRKVPGQGPVLRVTLGPDHKEVHKVRAEVPEPGSGDAPAVTGDEEECR